jgi:N-ethylmaleimide reductase
LIFLQLWHVGRISHASHQPGGVAPVAPSAIAANGNAFTSTFAQAPYPVPRALTVDDIDAIVSDFARGAENALEAGFDGVELHGANGYLIEQFLQRRSNVRDDEYGGPIENRVRFLMDVTRAVVRVAGADRTGVRLSPYGRSNDSGESDPYPLYAHAVRSLAKLDLAYLHFIEPRSSGAAGAEVDHQDVPSAAKLFRPDWPGTLITAGNFTAESAAATIASGEADAIAFGRRFISNPDLPERFRLGAPLNAYDRATFYGGGRAGYTDYPALAALRAPHVERVRAVVEKEVVGVE